MYDDDVLGYRPNVEPKSESALFGYTATAWNTDLRYTGLWQGRSVVGITTNDKLFDMKAGDISQAVQIQEFHETFEQLPWLCEIGQGSRHGGQK